MSDLSRYCPHCGAANPVESQLCFSCQHPFAESEEAAQGILLHERYQLLTQVGSGGFGGVYRSVDTAEGQRVVAVKQINLRGLSAQEIIEATDGFNREVRLLSTLRHPNLPVIRDTFTDPEHWYLVMDFIEGETLEAYLKGKAGASLLLDEVLGIGAQLCTVLDYLHTREPAIIFRDLKPSNVMSTSGGQIYLIDFGIARLFSPGKLKDTMPFGSPGYAAPEQYGRAQTTPQADIYSLGALLHCMLTGNDPAESPFRFAPLPMADSAELAELDALIQRMVATAPEERPASAAEVQTILLRLGDELRYGEYRRRLAAAPPTPVQVPAPTPRAGLTRRGILNRAFKIGGAVVAVGGIVGLCSAALNVIPHGGMHGSAAIYPPSPGTTQQQFVYRGHKGPITALSWSPDATMVASGSADGTVQVWRSADGVWLYTLSGYTDAVTSVTWASDRVNVIASAGNDDGTAQVWDALRDHRDLIFHGDGRVLALDWKQKSPWIVSGGTDQDIYTWNATTGAKGASYRGHKGNVNTVMWLSRAGVSAPGLTAVIPAPSPTPTPPPTPMPTSPPTPTPTPTLSIDYSNTIASGGADSTVQIWDAVTGRHILTYRGHYGAVNGLALVSSQYSSLVTMASASADGTVQIWSIAPQVGTEGPMTRTMYRGHHGHKVNAVVAFPGISNYYGALIASASDDETVQLWSENAGGAALMSYTAHRAPVKALALSPKDKRMVSGDADGQVHLWTVTTPSYQ
jgi:WD40 repeat protein